MTDFEPCQVFDITITEDSEGSSLVVLTEREDDKEVDLTPGLYLNGVLAKDDEDDDEELA